ncbi:MAG: hypothetical protein Q8903_13345 [Bacteroidota bacterium]|nr:hypothetical protein [Bacteroidota bacterium]
MRKIGLIFLLFVLMSTAFCQNKDSAYKYWMTFGFWVDKEITLDADYSFSLGDNFYKIGYLRKGDSFPITNSHAEIGKYLLRSVSATIGRRYRTDWFQGSVFCGPSFVYGENGISRNISNKFFTAGLQTDIQLLFRYADELGIGVGLYGNLNFKKNYGGININLTLGNGK